MIEFAFLPKKLGFDVHETNDVTIINCGFGSSMFNIAYGSPVNSNFETILRIKEDFKGQPFAWWVPPSQHNQKLTDRLLKSGFIIETIEHAMICELKNI